MKENFKEFYELSEQELSEVWANKETIFIFDTNILLNLYQYSEETQNEFFKILNRVKDRIWIPFHVALEYQRRRLDIIRNEKAVFKKIDDKLNNIKGTVGNNFSEFNLKARNPDLFSIEEKFKEDICSLVDVFKAEVERVGKSQPCVRSHDEIRVKLDDLLEGKVGDEPNSDWVEQVTKDGVTRYENEVPPGYKDVAKDRDNSKSSFTHNDIKYERKFGDLIIWKQILEHLKSVNRIKNVIFITDDSKEDWWEILDSNGKKNIGARPELKSEIYRETEIDSFKMYHTNDFLTAAKKYCGIAINAKAIEETEGLFNDLKLKNYMKEQLINLQQRHSENLSNKASLEERLANQDVHNSNFSRGELYRLQDMSSEFAERKESLREQLMSLQKKCFKADKEKELLRNELANQSVHNSNFSHEEFNHLQEMYSKAAERKKLLGNELDHLQEMYFRAARQRDLFDERLNNLNNQYIESDKR